MMIYLVLLALLAGGGFVVHTTARYGDADRPSDVSAPRWWWHTAQETAVMWGCYVRSVPARIRAWRDGEPDGIPPAAPVPVTPPAAANGSRPAAPHPPLPPVPPPPAPGTAAHARAGIPRDHAVLHERIAGYVPEDDADLLAMYAGEAAGALGQAEAWAAHIDVLFHEVGLDPVFLQAAAMLAEAQGELAFTFAVVGQRLAQVYALPQMHAAEGGTFPVDADTWFSGEVF